MNVKQSIKQIKIWLKTYPKVYECYNQLGTVYSPHTNGFIEARLVLGSNAFALKELVNYLDEYIICDKFIDQLKAEKNGLQFKGYSNIGLMYATYWTNS